MISCNSFASYEIFRLISATAFTLSRFCYHSYQLNCPANAATHPSPPKRISEFMIGKITQHRHHLASLDSPAATVFCFLAMFPPTSPSLLPAMARNQLRKSVLTHTRISAIRQQRQSNVHPAALGGKRYFSRVTWVGYPRKDSQDRESINTDATEYSKSSTDDEAARQEESAFDPNVTDPGAQKRKAGESSGVSTHREFETDLGLCCSQLAV